MARTNRKTARAVRNAEVITTRGEQKGMFLSGADYLLARLPFTKYKYQNWSKTKRILLGYLLWLIVLPVVPIVIMFILYKRDPQNFTKSPLFGILAAITVAWFGLGTGYVNSQVPVDSTDGQVNRGAMDNVRSRTNSEPTNGRTFENCTAAFNAGVYDIAKSNKSYEPRLDRDGDGIACER